MESVDPAKPLARAIKHAFESYGVLGPDSARDVVIVQAVAEVLTKLGAANVGVEAAHLTLTDLETLREGAPALSWAPTKKLVDEEVKIVQTGSSSLTPEKIAESWQTAAAAANNLNQSLNKMNVNGKITRILFLSTRTDPRQEVELEASRDPDSKVTQVEISSPLPKPEIGSE